MSHLSASASSGPVANMKMSPDARARMRATEKNIPGAPSWKAILALLNFVVLTIGLIPDASVFFTDDKDSSVIGNWRFTSPLDSSEITSLDEHEARQLVGKVMTIATDHVQFGSRRCPPPTLQAERVEPRLYLREQAHASASQLGLPDPVTVVYLGCTLVFVKSTNKLVIHWGGWFFDAVRVKQ